MERRCQLRHTHTHECLNRSRNADTRTGNNQRYIEPVSDLYTDLDFVSKCIYVYVYVSVSMSISSPLAMASCGYAVAIPKSTFTVCVSIYLSTYTY